MLTKNKKPNAVHILLLEQLRDVESCLLYFEGFMRAACTPETVHETLKSLAVNVGEAEAKADISLRKMIDSLQGHAYLPSTREDIIAIATICDKIANACEGIANHVVYQRFSFPAQFADDLLEIVSIKRFLNSVYLSSENALYIKTSFSSSSIFGSFNNLTNEHFLKQLNFQEQSIV